jgi:asparagine synthetase B (glutamine-hydrolysing)
LKGAYSLVIMTEQELIGVRDPYGFRPLSIGKVGDAWVLASETCAFDLIHAEFLRDVEPGEIRDHQQGRSCAVSGRFRNTNGARSAFLNMSTLPGRTARSPTAMSTKYGLKWAASWRGKTGSTPTS